jgi:hypothetical protein
MWVMPETDEYSKVEMMGLSTPILVKQSPFRPFYTCLHCAIEKGYNVGSEKISLEIALLLPRL